MGWDYEAYLAAVLAEEAGQREIRGSDGQVKVRFPRIKTLDDFNFSFQRSVKRQVISHLAQLDFLQEAKNVVCQCAGPRGVVPDAASQSSVFRRSVPALRFRKRKRGYGRKARRRYGGSPCEEVC